MKELFIKYLLNNTKSNKTIKHYVNVLTSRIAPFARKYIPNYYSMFALSPDKAKELILLLKDDEECNNHFKRSKNVHKSAFNQYLDFLKESVETSENPEIVAIEGDSFECHHLEYTRNKALRDKVAIEREYKCEICGIKFEKIYGCIGKDFIEVHHIIPLHNNVRETKEEDLLCVCSNCHSMLHRRNPPYTKEDLIKSISEMKELTKGLLNN